MLFQTIIEHCQDQAVTSGSRLPQLIDQAARFVFDENATAAMARLATMKPSNVLDAAAFLRPPALPLWIEYLDPVRKRVWQEECLHVDANAAHPNRSGMLVTEGEDGEVLLSVFWNFKNDETGEAFHTTPFAARVNLAFDGRVLMTVAARDPSPISFGYHFRNNPAELAALDRITAHGCAGASPLLPLAEPLIASVPQYLWRSWQSDVGQELVFLLASLLLLNCRNFGERKPVEFTKLNKSRAKARKPLLRDYTELKLRIPRGAMGTGTTTGQGAVKAAHWCRGHVKVRKTGAFWWMPHMRGLGGGIIAPNPPGGRTIQVKG